MGAPENSPTERCVVCGQGVSESGACAHLYEDGRRFAVCCPICMEMFNRAPERFARGEKPMTVVDELLQDLRWKEPPQS